MGREIAIEGRGKLGRMLWGRKAMKGDGNGGGMATEGQCNGDGRQRRDREWGEGNGG